MHLVLCMAGIYRRFRVAGYALPKYLLPWRGRTILGHILDHLQAARAWDGVLLVGNSRDAAHAPAVAAELVRQGLDPAALLQIGDTAGQADTALVAVQELLRRGADPAAAVLLYLFAGAGRIVSRGRNGGYGNAVVLAHKNGITTLYGHMSRFAKGQKVGDSVSQGQVIGYVGMTGLASGPHVHYEYRVNGVHKNPARVTVPKADPIPESLMADFKAQTAPLLARLDSQSAAPVQLATAPPAATTGRAGR